MLINVIIKPDEIVATGESKLIKIPKIQHAWIFYPKANMAFNMKVSVIVFIGFMISDMIATLWHDHFNNLITCQKMVPIFIFIDDAFVVKLRNIVIQIIIIVG
jgi:hypothetical protein